MNVYHVAIFTIQVLVIRTPASHRVPHLRIFRMIGFVQSAVLAKMNSSQKKIKINRPSPEAADIRGSGGLF